jgi:hypothetical protein
MKYLLAVLSAALLFTVAVPTQSTPNGAEARPYVRAVNICSVVMIAPGFALTADHCVNDPSELRLSPNGTVPVVVARGDDNLDYALLAYPQAEAPCPCVRLAASEAQVDEPVFIVGYPRMLGQVVTLGASQGVFDNERMPYGRRLVTTAQVAGGNSGGGVFVYRDGQFQLVGVLVESIGHLSFAVPLVDLRPFLERAMPRLQGASN